MMVWRGRGEGQQDNNKDYINKDDNDYDIGWGSGSAKRCRAATLMTLVDDYALDNKDLQQDSNKNKDYDCGNSGSGKTMKKKGRHLTSSSGKGIQDPLNTTATITDLMMNAKGKTQMMTSLTLREEGGGDNSF